jgi:hypothetical protein
MKKGVLDHIIMNEKLKEFKKILNNDIERDLNWLYGEPITYMALPLVASKMSKIIDYMRSDNPFGFISAFRKYDNSNKQITKKENMNITRKLVSDIRNKKYGYIQILGEFDEHDNNYINDNNIDKNGNVIGKHHVKEISFFVVGFNTDYKTFRISMLDLMSKYNQEGIITGYCKNKGDRPKNDKYYIELIDFEGKIDLKEKYSINTKNDIEKLIQNNNYQGHTRIDKKNFILSSYYTFRPNTLLGNQMFDRFENATGILL